MDFFFSTETFGLVERDNIICLNVIFSSTSPVFYALVSNTHYFIAPARPGNDDFRDPLRFLAFWNITNKKKGKKNTTIDIMKLLFFFII